MHERWTPRANISATQSPDQTKLERKAVANVGEDVAVIISDYCGSPVAIGCTKGAMKWLDLCSISSERSSRSRFCP
ncbi:hypothetical protein M378DRAFT_174466 [Amanita muscaria Koide BX008]|uniref:Uncharacterized protein n=1 Tax=Amanita muscaria (strain Koide BX008) TaxID=946122 RepID=A0A0C2WBV4_AMAMK|nr:hypothetical protein M378DRAFT_174466 [Amanita muscaria Koide BX008]